LPYTGDAQRDEAGLPSAGVLIEAVFKGVGQVWLADKMEAGVIITAGIFICSPITAFAALMGSLVGTATAIATGAPITAIASGLYGYNSSLTFGCIFGMWFCPSRVTLVVSIFAAVLATVMTDFMSGIFAPFGLPAATLPFCICALLFDLIQGATPKMVPVPLAQMTVPEDHYERDQTIRRALMAMAAIINQDKSDEFLRPYLPSRNKVISDQKQRDHERASRLFHALDESGDGVLEVEEFGSMLEAAGVPASKSTLLLKVFAEVTPPNASGLALAEWRAYIDVVVITGSLIADLKTFLEYADLDSSGGLDVTELLETQKSLCLDLLSKAQLADFVIACGAEDEDDDVPIDQIISNVVIAFLQRQRD